MLKLTLKPNSLYYREYRKRNPNIDKDYYEAHKEVIKEKARKRRAETTYQQDYDARSEIKEKGWAYSIKTSYGLTVEEYYDKLTEQNFRCAICGEVDSKTKNGKMAVDHDHKTGKVRDLLCRFCNVGLGFFKEDIELMRRAIEYLERHKD